jgi:hypothetical protein
MFLYSENSWIRAFYEYLATIVVREVFKIMSHPHFAISVPFYSGPCDEGAPNRCPYIAGVHSSQGHFNDKQPNS